MTLGLAVDNEVIVTVSEFVALLNQSLEYAFPSVTVTGELANFRVSKNRWVYFDLKDESSSVKCFATVYQLSGPLEDGMLLQVRATPRLHNLYGFSLTVSSMRATGEGTIRRAGELLALKLEAEGLFAPERKRSLPYPPTRIGLIASGESAAYVDFMKILDARWQGLEIEHIDVQVQGEIAPAQIVQAVEYFNQMAVVPDVLVLTRGGGSAEDLMAFSDERVVRAVAASRIPTLVAIGHEVDVSLAELAADVRASTPSNAAELLVPDKAEVQRALKAAEQELARNMAGQLKVASAQLKDIQKLLDQQIRQSLQAGALDLKARRQLLEVLSPQAILKRGYAVVRKTGNGLVRRAAQLKPNDIVELTFYDGATEAVVRKGAKS